MLIFYGCVITCVVGIVTAGAGGVTVECVSCDGGSTLKGVVGQNLTVMYTVNNAKFILLSIQYNTSSIVVTPTKVNRDEVTDKRFDIPLKPTKKGNTISIQITLRELTLHDNDATFKYELTNEAVKRFRGEDKTEVYTKASTDESGRGSGGSSVAIIITVIVIILVIIAILVLLCKKGILPTKACVNMCGGDSGGKREKVPAHQGDYEEPQIYAAPKNQPNQSNQPAPTEYAVLGPGGRLDKPKDKPEKSDYAEVKTTDVNYPDPNFEESPAVTV